MGGALAKVVFPVPTPSYTTVNENMAYFRKSGSDKRELAVTEDKIVWLSTSTGYEVPAVWAHNGSDLSKRKYTMIISHSQEEDLGSTLSTAKLYAKGLDCNIFCYEYSGYGVSNGVPSEENTYADIQAAYDYLIMDEAIDPANIILFGRDVGTGPSIELASKFLVGGLVLVNAFTSVLKALQSTKFNSKVSANSDMYLNLEKIAKVRCATLLIHGQNDQIVPIAQSRRLYEKLWKKVSPLWIAGADRSEVETVHRPECMERMKEFMEKLEPPDEEYIEKSGSQNSKNAINRLVLGSKNKRRMSSRLNNVKSSSSAMSTSFSDLRSSGPSRSASTDFVPFFRSNDSSELLNIENVDDSDASSISEIEFVETQVDIHQDESNPTVMLVSEATLRKVEAVKRIAGKKLEGELVLNDLFVLRCLRARKFDVREALIMTQRYIKLLKKLGVDAQTGVPLYSVETTLTQGIFVDPESCDKNGYGLFLIRLSKFLPKIIKWRHALKAMMFVMDKMILSNENHQRRGITVVLELRSWSLKEHYSSEFLTELFRTFSTSYPVVINSILLVDSTTAFNATLATMRPLMSGEISKKIVPDLTRKTLEGYVDKSNLPTFLGGSICTGPQTVGDDDKENSALQLRITGVKPIMTSLHRIQLESLTSPEL